MDSLGFQHIRDLNIKKKLQMMSVQTHRMIVSKRVYGRYPVRKYSLLSSFSSASQRQKLIGPDSKSIYLWIRRGVEMSMRVGRKKISGSFTSNFPFSISLKLAVIGCSDGTTSYLGQDTEHRMGKCTR